ncbi:MAG: hypothetical protein WCC12_07840 [Anaerolineales bacterium]
MRTSNPTPWQVLFILWGVQGIAALGWLLAIPTDTDNPLAFGFSLQRLALVSIAIGVIVISVWLWLQSNRADFHQTWLDLDKHFIRWDLIYLTALLVITAVSIFIITVPLFKNEPLYPVYAARLRPIILWFGLASVELAFLVAWNRYGKAKHIYAILQPIWKKALLLVIFFSLLGGLIAFSRIGITRQSSWGMPPIPFLEWQIFLTLAWIGIFVFFPKESHKWIPFGIYLFTVILWLSQPINTAFTATPPRAPNFEIYPFSDPQFYAQYAQSALTGNGFLWPEIPTRPFYVAFLTWLHLVGGQSYENIIVLQTFVLASFPMLLYLIGKEIGGRPLGLGLSVLAAFRDINANVAVPFASSVTYSKLFNSELPTALLVSLAALLAIRWLRMSNRPAWLSLLIGGVIGAAALVRLQSSVLIAVILLLAFFVISDRRQWLKCTIFVIMGFVLTLAPWLTRNYMAAGGLVLDNPISQTMTMARRWSGSTGNELLPRLPGENDSQYSGRLMKLAIASFKDNPEYILHSAANHFVNSEIASLLAFPVRDEILSPAELLMPQHVFWRTPLTASQIPLFAFYVLLFSIGLAAAWHYHGLIGLLPLGLGVAYNLWTALFLSSGARFIVPLDWSIHLYEIFGLLILGGVLVSFAQGARENISAWIQGPFGQHSIPRESPVSSRRYFILSLIFVLFLGAFLPVTEFIFPQKYPPISQEEILQQIDMPAETGEIALYGRAIYPRYYDAGDGEPGTAKLGYGAEERARLVFFLVGPQNGLVILELESAPQFFPNTADVYMIGTQTDNYFSPRVVKVIKDSRSELYINK